MDDLVLELGRAIDEIVAVAGHPDDEVAILLRLGLGRPEQVGRDHVELDVMSHQLEIGPDQVFEAGEARVVGQELGRELLVEERAAGPDVVELAERLDDRRRALAVGALDRRNAFRDGVAGPPPVGRGPGHLAEVDVGCRRQEVDPVGRAAGRRPPVHRLEIGLEDAPHQAVGVFVVVAELGRPVEDALAELLVALEIVFEGGPKLGHREVAVVVDVPADGAQDVRDRAHADALDVVRVVAGPAAVVIAPVLDAVVDEDRQERRRQVLGVEAFDDVRAADLDVDEVADLPAESLEELVERFECRRVAGLEADPFPRPRVDAVPHGDLEDLGQVEVSGQDVGLLAESPRFDAAAGPAVAGVGDRLALADELLDDGVGVEDRGLAEAGLDDLEGPEEERVRPLGADLDHRARLEDAHLLDDVEDEERQLVDPVGAVGLQAADVDQGKIGVRAALLGRDPDLGRRGLVVELDPEGLKELPGAFLGEGAVDQAFFIERPEVLIEPAGIERIPGIVLGDDAEVDEPVHLERFPEIARRLGRDAVADGRDPLQLLLAGRVLLRFRQPASRLGVTAGEGDNGIAAHGHGPELLLLVVGFGVPHEVEGGQSRGDVALEVIEALLVDLAVEDGVTGSALLHELGEHAGLVGVDPSRGHLGEDAVPLRPPLPERDDLLGVDAPCFLVGGEGGLFAVVKIAEVLDRMDADLGVGRGRLGRGPALPDDELAVVDDDGLSLHEMLEGQGVLHRPGQGECLRSLVELGHEPGPLGRDRRLGLERLCPELLDAVVHDHPPRRTSKPARRNSASIAAKRSSDGGSNLRKCAPLPMRPALSRPPA